MELKQEVSDETRERIIRAAGEIFAADGFQVATVRSICEKAQVNIASVNYYFRDKLGLYTEVLRESMLHEKLPSFPKRRIQKRNCVSSFARWFRVC